MTDPLQASSVCGVDQLTTGAVMAAAALEVSRGSDLNGVAQRIGCCPEATTEELLGFWQGHVFGVVRFPAPAAAPNGSSYGGTLARHEGWVSARTSPEAPLRQVYRDAGDFPPSSHLLALLLGSWPVKLNGELPGMPLGGRSIIY